MTRADAVLGRGESILERPARQSPSRMVASARRSVARRCPLIVPAQHAVQARAHGAGELRGRHYWVATGGYLHQVGRLPTSWADRIFAGGWLENGDAFDEWSDSRWRTNGGAGVVGHVIGPVMLAGSWGFDGRWHVSRGGTDFSLTTMFVIELIYKLSRRN
jgi:hypothetical protein